MYSKKELKIESVQVIRQIIIFAAVVLVVDYFLEMTFFATILSIDIQRLEVRFLFLFFTSFSHFFFPSFLVVAARADFLSLPPSPSLACSLPSLTSHAYYSPSVSPSLTSLIPAHLASQLADLLTQGHLTQHQRHLPSTPSDLDDGELLEYEMDGTTSTTSQHFFSILKTTKSVFRDRAARTTTFGMLFLIDSLLYLAWVLLLFFFSADSNKAPS